MKILGLDISRQKAAPNNLAPVSNVPGKDGWWPIIREAFAGAWQRNMEQSVETVASHFAVYACVQLISKDIGKLRFVLKRQTKSLGIWKEVSIPTVDKLLRRPNRYQNHIQFKTQWVLSKLLHGNTYVLKERSRGTDGKSWVTSLYILDPTRVKVLTAPDGSVYYSLSVDNLAGLDKELIVPASEIVHDRCTPLYHPLVGVSPLSACGLTAIHGLRIQEGAADFFANSSLPGGFISAPASVSQEKVDQIAKYFQENFTGRNAGSIAVVGDAMTFNPLSMSATDSQLIEQLKWGAEAICAAFGVPAYKVLGQTPNMGNVESMELSYYSQCLQEHMESMETLMDDALEFDQGSSTPYGIELDLMQLVRMDSKTRNETHAIALGAGYLKPNEARFMEDREDVEGGDTCYMQQQMYAISALAKRDEGDPLSVKPVAPAVPALPAPEPEDNAQDEEDANKLAEEKAAAMMLEFTTFLHRGLKDD